MPAADAATLEITYQDKREQWIARHQFLTQLACDEFARDRQRQWLAEGFRLVVAHELVSASRPRIVKFPPDATYLRRQQTVIGVHQVFDAVWSAEGEIGVNFADTNKWEHFDSPAQAAANAKQLVATHESRGFVVLGHAEVVALYER